MNDELDPVFKALADGTRRKILDLLKDRAQTTGQLCAEFPQLSRFAVMKHLGVLEGAGLVVVRRQGRERFNHLNSVPIRQIYERWMGPYAELWSSSLLRLKDYVERDIRVPGRGGDDAGASDSGKGGKPGDKGGGGPQL
ncbi:helix-turn-helix transcriptional regulator [bacterium]|nr:helix-turn-helix transcriptional regulator [bacterium]